MLFQLHGGMVSHMQVLATHFSTVHNINTWILTSETILVLAELFLRQRCRDVASGTDRHLDIGLQVVEMFPYF